MRSIRTASLAALATTVFSAAALAQPGLPGHSQEGRASPDTLLAMIAGALAASLTVWALSRRRAPVVTR